MGGKSGLRRRDAGGRGWCEVGEGEAAYFVGRVGAWWLGCVGWGSRGSLEDREPELAK